MIIPSSVTFMIWGFIASIALLYFGLRYIDYKIEQLIEKYEKKGLSSKQGLFLFLFSRKLQGVL